MVIFCGEIKILMASGFQTPRKSNTNQPKDTELKTLACVEISTEKAIPKMWFGELKSG
jgi:hypothetical protein